MTTCLKKNIALLFKFIDKSRTRPASFYFRFFYYVRSSHRGDWMKLEYQFLHFTFICFWFQVQPVAELVELSRRWAADGRQIRLNDVIAKGGTLRRTGSLRHRHTKVPWKRHLAILLLLVFTSPLAVVDEKTFAGPVVTKTVGRSCAWPFVIEL